MSDSSKVPAFTKGMRDRVTEALRGVTKIGDLDAFMERIASTSVVRVPKKPPVVPEITEQHIEALRRLPDLYGKVVPKSDRPLTAKELAAIVEERQTIDLVLKLLGARKDDSIRETLANHLDHLYYKAHPGEEPPTDPKGHVAVKGAPENEVLVKGTTYKVARSVSGGKRALTYNDVVALKEQGTISQEQFDAITREVPAPPTPRMLDEEGLVNAMKGDPMLAYTLAQAARTTDVNTAITVKDAS